MIWEDGEEKKKKKIQKLTTQTVALYCIENYVKDGIANEDDTFEWFVCTHLKLDFFFFNKSQPTEIRIQSSISIDCYSMILISFISCYFFELNSFERMCLFA